MGKRGNGEGTIYKDHNRWRAQLVLPNGTRKSVYGNTRQEVRQKLAHLQREVEAGMHGRKDNEQTFSEFAIAFLALKKNINRKRTYRFYESYYRNHCQSLYDIPIAKVTAQDIQKIYAEKLASGLSKTSVHHIHSTIHVILDAAERMGLVMRNVADLVKAPQQDKKEQMTLSDGEVLRFFDVIRGDRLEALYILTLTTGLRECEVLGLKWPDIDFQRGTMTIRQTLLRDNGKLILESNAKSEASAATLKISRTALQALLVHREKQREEKEDIGEAWDDSWNLIFCTQLGTPIDPTHLLERQFRKRLADAGLNTELRFHDLRHTIATLLRQHGVEAKIVQHLLRHSSIQITLDLYGHVTSPMIDAANQTIDRLYSGDDSDHS